VEILTNPHSTDARFPGALFRISLRTAPQGAGEVH